MFGSSFPPLLEIQADAVEDVHPDGNEEEGEEDVHAIYRSLG